MADSKLQSSGPIIQHPSCLTPSDSSREIPILKILAELIGGSTTADEAAVELQLLGAPGYLIRSLHSIEQQFSDPDPGYCGPMASAVGKVLGDV